ncbi:MAG TPA: class I SAM-dependent methyltransferase [Pirellulales bacterium]|nr:class I SAM-dependent methyltransferase [Pirellulales bacterium]
MSHGFRGRAKTLINRALAQLNLQLTGLTAQRRENQRLRDLAQSGYFDRPAFPMPPALEAMDATPVFLGLEEYLPRFADFADDTRNDVGFSLANSYFSSPDAEVLYTIVRRFQPARIVEIGSGNSTRVSRQAILDGALSTRLMCVDPCPRTDVSRSADEVFLRPAEDLIDDDVFRSLTSGDILFVDSSHELRPGNDCVALFLRLLPMLPSGILIHVHDIFLPYDYPPWWMEEGLGCSEQYIIQAMLMAEVFDVLWASQYLLHSDQRLSKLLPRAAAHNAASLWVQKR